jgi:hypothetical protein
MKKLSFLLLLYARTVLLFVKAGNVKYMPDRTILKFLSPVLFYSLFLISSSANAATYYIATNGKDCNPGTEGSPWQTIDKVNNTSFQAGDSILFQGGAIFSGTIYFAPDTGGTAANPITVSSYGSGRAIIDGGSDSAFYAYNTAGLALENLEFRGSGAGVDGGVIFYNDLPNNVSLSYIHINNIDVHGFGAKSTSQGGNGLLIVGWNGLSGYRDIKISNSKFYDNAHLGLVIVGSPSGLDVVNHLVRIDHVEAYNNRGRGVASPYSGGGIHVYNSSDILIEYSSAHDNGAEGNGGAGFMLGMSDHATIQNSIAYHNRTSGDADGDGFDIDWGTTDSVVQYNYSYGNDGAGFLMASPAGFRPLTRNVIRYNISENDAAKNSYGALQIWNGGSGISDNDIYSNTIFIDPAKGGGQKAVRTFGDPTANLHLFDNIFFVGSGAGVMEVDTGNTGLGFHEYYSTAGNLNIN